MKMEQIIQANYGSYASKATDTNTRAEPRQTAEAADSARNAEKSNGFESVGAPIERLLKSVGVELKFHIHEDTGEVQAEVRDADGEKILRKIPPDAQLDLAASIKELSTIFLNRSL